MFCGKQKSLYKTLPYDIHNLCPKGRVNRIFKFYLYFKNIYKNTKIILIFVP